MLIYANKTIDQECFYWSKGLKFWNKFNKCTYTNKKSTVRIWHRLWIKKKKILAINVFQILCISPFVLLIFFSPPTPRFSLPWFSIYAPPSPLILYIYVVTENQQPYILFSNGFSVCLSILRFLSKKIKSQKKEKVQTSDCPKFGLSDLESPKFGHREVFSKKRHQISLNFLLFMYMWKKNSSKTIELAGYNNSQRFHKQSTLLNFTVILFWKFTYLQWFNCIFDLIILT